MEFDFETLVERSGANLKLMMTPPEVVKAGNISLDGAEPDFKVRLSSRRQLFALQRTDYTDLHCRMKLTKVQ